jgi:RNA polymerase sigma-70 factor (sigma-E family)
VRVEQAERFSAFVVEHEKRLLRIAYLLTGDAGHAEDLLQTALAKTYRHWPRVEADGQAVAYVRRVMVNTHISWRRRLAAHERVTGIVPDQWVDDAQNSHAVRDEVRQALLRLSPRVRAVLVLRYFEDLTEVETARLLGCSVSTVNTHATRGIAALRRHWTAPAEHEDSGSARRRP